MKNVFVAIVLMFIACVTGCSSGSSDSSSTIPTLTADQKRADFDYMYGILSENYPYFEVNKRANGIDWLPEKDEYREAIAGTADNISFANELVKIVRKLNCGHTNVILEEFSLYADVYTGNYESQTSIEPWKKIFSEALPYYNDYWIPLFKKYFNVPALNSQLYSPALSNKSMTDGSAAEFKIVETGKTAYMSISSMAIPTSEEYSKIVKFYTQIKDYDNLIIDIRKNSGGDDTYWAAMVIPPLLKTPITASVTTLYRSGSYVNQFLDARKIVASDISSLPAKSGYPAEYNTTFSRYYTETGTISPKDSVGFSGKIYVLTSGTVFSSSESFAMFCKQTGFATLVGTVTGGDGGGMDPAEVILPNSKLVIRFPSGMPLNADGSSNFEKKTTPDVLIGSGEDAYNRTLSLISGK